MKQVCLYILLFFASFFNIAQGQSLDSLLLKLNDLEEDNSAGGLDQKSIYCNSIAIKYQGLGKQNEARTYFLQSLHFTRTRIELTNDWNAQNLYDMGLLYRNLATFESTLGNFDQSLVYLKETETYFLRLKSFLSSEEWGGIMISFYETSSVISYHKKEWKEAHFFINKAIKLGETPEIGYPRFHLADLHRMKGEFYSKEENYESAISSFDKALYLIEQEEGVKIEKYRFIYSKLAGLYNQNKNEEIDLFLNTYPEYSSKEAILSFAKDQSYRDIGSFSSILYIWGFAKNNLYQETGDDNYLKEALKLYFVAFQLIEKGILHNEADRMANMISNAENKMYALYRIYTSIVAINEEKRSDIIEILRITDLYNSSRLHLERLHFELNTNLWAKQKEVRNQLDLTEARLDELISSGEGSDREKDSLRAQAYLQSGTLQELYRMTKKEKVLNEYEIGQSSYDSLLTTFIQTSNKTVLSYFHSTSSDSLYIIGVNSDTSFFKTVPVAANFIESIEKTYQLNAEIQMEESAIQEQKELNKQLYQYTIKPVLGLLGNSKDLLIYPLNHMSFIAFDALMDDNSNYLVEEFSFQYTSSLYSVISEPISNSIQEKGFSSFYPSNYGDPSLAYLLNAENEVDEIEHLLKGNNYKGREASRTQFILDSKDNRILHVASHSILNLEQPYDSYILFNKNEEEEAQQNKLFAHEIFSLNMESDLITLSSCNSAQGRLEDGIGVVSLSNALYFAGVPATVGSLWSAQDKSSSEIMVSFYSYLNAGKAKSESLRQAKLDYLKQADKVHKQPFFWANYVLYGSDVSLYQNENSSQSNLVWWIMIPAGLILIVILIRRKRSA